MPASPTPLRILYIEDEPFVAHETVTTLAEHGLRDVEHFRSWAPAQRRLGAKAFDVGLLDIELGRGERLDGIDIGAILDQRYGIPAVYLTSHTADWVVQRLSAQPRAHYTEKTTSPTNLVTLLRLAVTRAPVRNVLSPDAPGKLAVQRQEIAFPKDGRVHHRLNFRDLLYLQVEDSYTIAYVKVGERISKRAINLSLREAIGMFNRDDIVQVSKGVAIPYHAIQEIHSSRIRLLNGEEHEIGRAYKEAVRMQLL